MWTLAKHYSKRVLEHRYGLTAFAFLAAAAVTGAACVLFMWAFEAVLARRFDFDSIGVWAWVVTPALFLASVELIRRVAPFAAGTGIPQTVFASEHLATATERDLRPLTSPVTMAVKIAALLIALLAGASTGREGPTVHIAACVFVGVMLFFRRFTGLAFDLRSAAVAGGSAGLAAAFNTPLAGVTFAIEELSGDWFGSVKDFVLMAIIIAGVTAKAMTGEYIYFGKLAVPSPIPMGLLIVIGVAGGLAGALFSESLMRGQEFMKRFRGGWGRGAAPVALALALLALASAGGTRLLGPGNQAAQTLLGGKFETWAWHFPLSKMLATLLTYWSGIAGGIFAPCLGIGAALGADISQWWGGPLEACALVGMAAFLSGTIQAPITSFVIIFEMTGHHQMLLPVMLGALIAYITARVVGARHFYQTLADSYSFLLKDSVQGLTEAPRR